MAFGLSIAAHLILVALYPSFFSGIPEADMEAGGFVQTLTPTGTELVNLVELRADQEPPPPEEVPEAEVEVISVQVQPTGVVAPPGPEPPEFGPPGPTAAERIRPKRGDLRYWAPVDPSRSAPTREEVMRLQLAAELEALNDSAAIAAELERRATDWTFTDEEGKRWGVSPGKIHLGDLTLPMPFAFGTSSFDRERAEDRLWLWEEVERGAATGAVIQTWRERDRAIRERMNAERKPDTTRTGGGGS